MPLPSFGSLPLGVNLMVFGVAAGFVWAAGTWLAATAEEIAERTGVSRAFLGALLLGVATSLPEIATTITAARAGQARLVAGNLFGGVAVQVSILAIVDLIAVRGALTYFTPRPLLLLQGVMLVLLLAVALGGAAAGEPASLAGVGLTPVLLLAGYLLVLYMSLGGDVRPPWRATDEPGGAEDRPGDPGARSDRPLGGRTYLSVGLAALGILVPGWVIARTGEVLAEQTGLGSGFVGVALVAVSTSMPEISTTLAAVRRGSHAMAVSNILGTNCLEAALFFPADLFYRPGPILADVDRSALVAGALGIVVTCLFLLGLLERRNRTVLGMGVDSALVLAAYAIGVGLLYHLR